MLGGQLGGSRLRGGPGVARRLLGHPRVPLSLKEVAQPVPQRAVAVPGDPQLPTLPVLADPAPRPPFPDRIPANTSHLVRLPAGEIGVQIHAHLRNAETEQPNREAHAYPATPTRKAFQKWAEFTRPAMMTLPKGNPQPDSKSRPGATAQKRLSTVPEGSGEPSKHFK